MTAPTCSQPDCDRPRYGGGLCSAHWYRAKTGSSLTGPIRTDPVHIGDDVFMPCPDTLLELAGWCADLDARAIVRTLWPHFLEASFAGVEAFTLEANR